MYDRDRYFDCEGVPFKYDSKSNKLFRMFGDEFIETNSSDARARVLLRSGEEVPKERAVELAVADFEEFDD